LDVTEPAVTAFVHALYDELAGLVQSNMIHIGGDEVSLDCWKQSSKIKDWLQRHNMTNEEQLLAAFEMDLLKYTVNKLKKRPIVWQEVFDAGIQLPDDTIVDVWKEWDMTALSAASNKYDVIVSACWYLDHLDKDWYSFYRCDPRAFNGTIHQKRHILGGHASMWGERVDETNFMSRVWPRASAVAEKLWTGNVTAAEQSAAERLDRFRCFMVQRDFDASPIGPGSCARRYSDSLQPLAPLIGKTSYQ
jgi:hexosaminidase